MDKLDKIPFRERIAHAWNVFRNKDPSQFYGSGSASGYSGSGIPYRPGFSATTEKSIVTSIYNRIAVDTASLVYRHVLLDTQGRYLETTDSYLNKCLNLEANIDQTGRAFIEDIILRLLDNGKVAIVPTLTSEDPETNDAFDIKEMRVGDIKEWFPKEVRVELYNDVTGERTEYMMKKRAIGVIENPFYPIMNEPNSTAQRLKQKLYLLDSVDNRTGANRLDLLIQVPYTIKTDLQKKLADARLRTLEETLERSKLGIGYVDGSEHVVQLNRSVENQLVEQVTTLTAELMSQLGMTMEILNGTADTNAMNNYFNRTIEPLASAICDEMTRKFLTSNSRTRGYAVKFYRDPFKLLPITDVAEIADKFTRNCIATSNEIRQSIGMMPSKDPKADELKNSNISESKNQQDYDVYGDPVNNTGGINQNGEE